MKTEVWDWTKIVVWSGIMAVGLAGWVGAIYGAVSLYHRFVR